MSTLVTILRPMVQLGMNSLLDSNLFRLNKDDYNPTSSG